MMPAPVLGPIGDLATHAHHYAETGLEVFPAHHDKTPHTANGFYDAANDPTIVDAWWARWSDALIACRVPPGLVLLDVDPRHGGLETWLALKAALGGKLPVTRAHQSGRGDLGTHFWWLRPAEKLSTRALDEWARERGLGQELGPNRWTAGIDILHHTCRYTILPPSPHPATGEPYRWHNGRGLEIDPAPMPALLADLLVVDDPAPTTWTPPPAETDSIADWYSSRYLFTEILRPHGWRIVAGDGNQDGSRWRHPDTDAAHSATIRHGCLFVYSTSTVFEPTTPGQPCGITPFRAYAILEHDGDLSAAAAAARRLKDPTPADDTSWIPQVVNTAEVVEADPVVVVHESDPDIHALLAEPHQEYDWLIPGLLERGDRTIVTGPEGGGKTTLLRQIAVTSAAGLHPFTEDAIDPIRVLYVDLENSRRQTAREFAPLVFTAGTTLAGNMLIPLIRPEGLDLLTRADCQWLAERIEANQPDLLIIGPLYKLALGDPVSEEVARHVAFVLDALRKTYRVAMLIEAHQPHKSNGSVRPERPYGASLWMRWPEFGLALGPNGFIHHWRGPRDERDWPTVLRRGGTWPWTTASVAEATYAALVAACRDAGHILSERELTVATGIPKTTVHRALEANRQHWNLLTEELPE
jgi:hypothetical protein